MHRAFHPDDLMAILDGIDDAVVKLEWTGEFHCLKLTIGDYD